MARLGLLAMVVMSTACGATSERAASRSGDRKASAPGSVSASTAVSPAPAPAAPLYATRALAGAEECKVALHELGSAYFIAGMTTDVVTGFGARGGLAAFSAPDKELSVRPLDRTGKPRGAIVRIDVPQKFSPRHVVGIEGGFVVIGDLYEFSHMRAAAVATDENGKALGTAVELDLEHRYISDIAPPHGREIVVLATRALMVPDDKDSLRGKWLAIRVAPNGKIEQHASELAMAYPLVRVMDVAYPLELDGRPAWYIRRGGDGGGELIRDGKLERIRDDELAARGIKDLNPADRVDWAMSFDASGATFERIIDGKGLGKPVQLPPGIGLTVEPSWTGTSWAFGYSSQAGSATTAHIAMIDCR
jgi:hypothetical protein